ncbi:hypothetical protein ACOME3_007187 [Neoechinorhynchus agilis]
MTSLQFVTNCSDFQIPMSALFNFQSLMIVMSLLVCTCTYIKAIFPSVLTNKGSAFITTLWKFARIGERKSPYMALTCIALAFAVLYY